MLLLISNHTTQPPPPPPTNLKSQLYSVQVPPIYTQHKFPLQKTGAQYKLQKKHHKKMKKKSSLQQHCKSIPSASTTKVNIL
ncbi:hypothetical protein EMIT0194MI4_10653 [Pseudomonas sp. IT-194MI4]